MNLIEAAHVCSNTLKVEVFKFKPGDPMICPGCQKPLDPKPVTLFEYKYYKDKAKAEFIKRLFTPEGGA
ncbi:MAG: hypothetical protein UV61_C0004G0019 [Candidatus Gottesmanbacteria bacterium GW2011_GWB1_43_11]|uniref:Uncharacterized protein n=1 Tax=Candidatus Gottesmanbacteria bacterium GW2011_GWB1_43_11 TaxID=1618446 RepID=A0A0G1FJR6_9BACT|nr:MAG: hypothetical protein UV04_C0007G0020 [Candidatus Gottesmanbacteria bacterium GW2011_GWA2_42_16]KKS54094.1 MAG: hypothetical protein UV17_C0027G0003 [Candidatus Gottesmanbacteria bacterium GW2011_GWA1_42_26]KKS82194.1 MAG: hypothetical protein UV55_C0004G0010 [Candidatus Gottesmanbacteria bacterium GW2011_GWC1_43_10]KKS87093.1 MAG: hypothetical protein UV61_C0004G0019 [Candidatus Gottesmanbacteria bacterium GW2011_GWB1_43_11]OGG10418.1 MAG: hypothetical protein A2699_05120 [Candidatus Go